MTKNTLLLNCFPAILVPLEYDLPIIDFESWEVSTTALRRDYGNFSWYRLPLDVKRVRAVLLNGPHSPGRIDTAHLNVRILPEFGKNLIGRSISRYFGTRGFEISRTSFGTTTILRRLPEVSYGFLDTYCGISFQVRRPFAELPENFVVSAQWEVSPRFNQSIAEPQLAAISKGMAVIYRPSRGIAIPEELRAFVNRYLGHVLDWQAQGEARVDCKDHVVRRMALSDLFFEASPAVIRLYEKQSGMSHSSRSLWYKLQELSFVLNKQGRRNASVLKDRLQAIRSFFGGNTREQLIIPLDSFQEGSVTLSLTPIKAEVIQSV